jgi:hypothetical protein
MWHKISRHFCNLAPEIFLGCVTLCVYLLIMFSKKQVSKNALRLLKSILFVIHTISAMRVCHVKIGHD